MKEDKDNMTNLPEDLEVLQEEIKESLKKNVSEEVYDTWVDNFVFEKIDSKSIVIGYYGDQPLKKLDKVDKKIIHLHICSIVGYPKKLRIYKRSETDLSICTPGLKKKLTTAKFFSMSLVFAALALAIVVLMFNYISNRNFAETFYNASSLKVDSSIRIINISDLHSSLFGKDNQKLISRVKKLDPDIIICTGDIIDSGSNTKREDKIVETCSNLTEIAPVYFIYGNNEVERIYDFPLNQNTLDEKFGFTEEKRNPYKLNELEDPLEDKLEKGGVKVLKNETDTIKVGSVNVDIFGVLTSNPSSFWTYSGETFENYIYSNPDNLKITAIHEPFIFEEFSVDFWGDLMICGHTHGGTVRVPVLGPLYTYEGGFFPERDGNYIYGRYDVSGRPLIVSGGMESNNILRINNQPELVVVDINKF